MSSFNLIVIFALLIIIVVLLVIVISMLNKKDNSSNKNKKKSITNKYTPLPNIENISLPNKIEKLSSNELQIIAKKIYDSYRCFDYKNMNINQLEKKEWHSWQVSILLMIYKEGDEFFIPSQNDVFNDFLLKSNENSIKSIMKDILNKYENYVDFNSGKDKLSSEYIWSDKDVSIIFYFLANYKKYTK